MLNTNGRASLQMQAGFRWRKLARLVTRTCDLIKLLVTTCTVRARAKAKPAQPNQKLPVNARLRPKVSHQPYYSKWAPPASGTFATRGLVFVRWAFNIR
jgi:hypothetical protein